VSQKRGCPHFEVSVTEFTVLVFTIGVQNLKTRYGRNSASRFRSYLSFCILAFFALQGRSVAKPETYAELYGKPIRSIGFSADQALEPNHYAPFIGIKPGDLLTRTGVKGAIQFLYETGRFAQIFVEAFPENDGVSLQFKLRFNYYFNRFSIEGDVDLKGRSISEWVRLPVGERFTEEKLEQARQAVAGFMKDRGFYLAQVKARFAKEENTRQVDTVFEVVPGNLASIRSVELTGVPPSGSGDLLKKFGFQKGEKYDRSRLNGRLDNLRKYFVEKGYLAASAQVSESVDLGSNTVALVLNVASFGEVRVVVEGFKIDKDELRRLLPVLAGEGITQEILEEGLNNLKEFLENKGYPEAEVQVSEKTDDSGIRVLRYVVVPNRKFTVEYVRFRGNRTLTSQEMLASVEIQPAKFLQRTVYSVERLDNDESAQRSL
jgi:outer membrane protein assembly factor BamA